MLKNIWQKIKQNHLLLMAVCCLAPIILVLGLLSLYKGNNNYWVWLIILLCPLAHIFMMKGHGHGNTCEKEMDKKSLVKTEYQCPECGCEYKEKELAKKCEVWCKEHNSCNVEITKYAINKG